MTSSVESPSVDPATQLARAKAELIKLPLLGPLAWLLARDQHRRFTFFADIDWRFMPPLVLDQCRLYNRFDLPWAFVTWARVSEVVDRRLREESPSIAPHEWQSGEHLWLIDVVAPFGAADALIKQVVAEVAHGQSASAWLLNANGQPELKEIRSHD